MKSNTANADDGNSCKYVRIGIFTFIVGECQTTKFMFTFCSVLKPTCLLIF